MLPWRFSPSCDYSVGNHRYKGREIVRSSIPCKQFSLSRKLSSSSVSWSKTYLLHGSDRDKEIAIRCPARHRTLRRWACTVPYYPIWVLCLPPGSRGLLVLLGKVFSTPGQGLAAVALPWCVRLCTGLPFLWNRRLDVFGGWSKWEYLPASFSSL